MYSEYLFIFFLSLFFIKVIKKYAPLLGLIDIPNERSVHKIDIPRGAGIGFFFAINIVLSYFYIDILHNFIWINIAIWMVFFMGVWDDFYDSKPYIKFLVFIIATFLLSFDHLLINSLGIYFGAELSLGFFALPFTIFAVVGFTNASNLIDGLDGLAATIGIVILATFYFIGFIYHDIFIMILSGAFISGLLAFLMYNWFPASIFMGDSGSLTLGFVISLLAVKSLDYIPAISIFYIAAIPIMDTLIVMIRRKLHKKSMFQGDQCHIHHILKESYVNHTPKTVMTLVCIQIIYSIMGLFLHYSIDAGYLLLFFILNLVILYQLLNKMIKKQEKKC